MREVRGEPVKLYLKGRFLQFWEGQQTTLAEMPQVLRPSLGTARLTGQKTGKQGPEWNSAISELVGPSLPAILHSLGNKCKVSPLWEAGTMYRPTLLSAPIPLGGQGRTHSSLVPLLPHVCVHGVGVGYVCFVCVCLQHSAHSFLPSEGSVELCGTEHKIWKEIESGRRSLKRRGIRVYKDALMKHLISCGCQARGRGA